MSDEQQPTPVDLLVDRLSQRVGQLTVENEWLKVQLELAQAQQPQDVPFAVESTNGHGAQPSHDVQSVI